MVKWMKAFISISCHASWEGEGTGSNASGFSTGLQLQKTTERRSKDFLKKSKRRLCGCNAWLFRIVCTTRFIFQEKLTGDTTQFCRTVQGRYAARSDAQIDSWQSLLSG